MTILVMVGGEERLPCTEKEVLGANGLWLPLLKCGRIPFKKYYSGVSNFNISPIGISSPFKWQYNWLKRVAIVLVPSSMGFNSDGGLAPKTYAC